MSPHVHRALERELLRLFRPEVVDAVLADACEEVARSGGDLRRIVGARLLDALGDALADAAMRVPPADESHERETLPVLSDTRPIQLPDGRRERDRRTRRWTPASELSRRAG